MTQAERDAFTPTMDAAMASFANMPEEPKAKMMEDFGKMMAGDEELKQISETNKTNFFAQADANGDGLLSWDEYKAYVALHKAFAE